MDAARQRVLAQLTSVAECVQGMAATGLLHTRLYAHTLQTSARQHERDGEWVAETIVTCLPPKQMMDARWSPELCAAAMHAAVVMSVVVLDHRAELVEYRELAAVLAVSWPTVDAALARRFEFEWGTPYGCNQPVDRSPWGVAVHHVHRRLRQLGRECHPPDSVEVGAIHVFDFARRTLQWVGSRTDPLVEPLAE